MDFGHPAAIFVSSFIIGLSGAMIPGPLLAVTIRHASIRGFSAGRGGFTDRAYRGVVGACAVFLVFFALTFGYLGVSRLVHIL
jgi:threonine/homoserine/homoserine lactone efflux protein